MPSLVLRSRGTESLAAKRMPRHQIGSRKCRYVLEASFERLFTWLRMRVRCKSEAIFHLTFLALGYVMICCRCIKQFVLNCVRLSRPNSAFNG